MSLSLQNEEANRRAKELRANPTPSEKIMLRKLRLWKIIVIPQYIIIRGVNENETKLYYCIVDFYLPNYNVVIELDGGYHLSKEQKVKDEYRDDDILSKDMSILRMRNGYAYSMTEDKFNTYLEVFKLGHPTKIKIGYGSEQKRKTNKTAKSRTNKILFNASRNTAKGKTFA